MTTNDQRPAQIAATFRRFAAEMAKPAPLTVDCPECEGHGEIYRADSIQPLGYDGPFGRCPECDGACTVPAMCSMTHPACKHHAITVQDGEYWCAEHAEGPEDHTATGLMAALAVETIRATETN